MPSKNSKPRIPSYRLHKPSGQAVVRLNGRDFYLGTYGSPQSQQAYERLVAEWLEAGRQLPPGRGRPAPATASASAADLTIDELIAGYVEHATTYYVKRGRPTSTQQHITDALRPLHDLYGSTEVTAFGPLAFKAVRQRLVDRGWAVSTINKAAGIIKRMFRWGVENELVPSAVYEALRAVPGLKRGRSKARDPEPVRPVPEDAIEAVLPHVSQQVATMIRLQLLTGMRPGEAVAMRRVDFDTADEVWVYVPAGHKTEHQDRHRAIYIGLQAQSLLKRDAEAYLFSPPSDANGGSRR